MAAERKFSVGNELHEAGPAGVAGGAGGGVTGEETAALKRLGGPSFKRLAGSADAGRGASRQRVREPRDGRSLGARVDRRVRERLVALAPHLPGPERVLVECVYGSGRTAADVARLTGLSARTVRARLRRLAERLEDPLFAWVTVHEEALPRKLRLLARGNILERRPLWVVAGELGMTFHEARALRQSIVSLAQLRVVAMGVEGNVPAALSVSEPLLEGSPGAARGSSRLGMEWSERARGVRGAGGAGVVPRARGEWRCGDGRGRCGGAGEEGGEG